MTARRRDPATMTTAEILERIAELIERLSQLDTPRAS